MTFTDGDARLAFHGAHTMLQMICQVFESEAFQYSKESEFVALLDEETAILGVLGLSSEAQQGLLEAVNKVFPRYDDQTTCSLHDEDLGLFFLLSTGNEDLLVN